MLETKHTAGRIENHELLEFVNKMKKLYKKSIGGREPSLQDVHKWVRALVKSENVSTLK